MSSEVKVNTLLLLLYVIFYIIIIYINEVKVKFLLLLFYEIFSKIIIIIVINYYNKEYKYNISTIIFCFTLGIINNVLPNN